MSNLNNDTNMSSQPTVISEVVGRVGCITLNRPKALNALSLEMIRLLTQSLIEFQANPQVLAVLVRGQGKEEPFGHFCAGGDIVSLYHGKIKGVEVSKLTEFFA
jgi:enoyl-CoA hydratase/carnithine racemase